MTEKQRAIYELGLRKQAELDAQSADDGALSPEQVATAIEKIASTADMTEKDIPAKVAVLAFDAAYEGNVKKTASLLAYLG